MSPPLLGLRVLGVVAAFHAVSLLAVLGSARSGAPAGQSQTVVTAPAEPLHPPAVFRTGAVAYIVERILIEQVILMLAYDCQHRLDNRELGAAVFSVQAVISIPVTYVLGRIVASR